MSEPREQNLPYDLVERCKVDPTLRYAVQHYLAGDWTLDHAMIQAALNLSVALEASHRRLTECIARLPKANDIVEVLSHE